MKFTAQQLGALLLCAVLAALLDIFRRATGLSGFVPTFIYAAIVLIAWRALTRSNFLARKLTPRQFFIALLVVIVASVGAFVPYRLYAMSQERLARLRPYELKAALYPNEAFFVTSLGGQYLLAGYIDKAEECAKRALALDSLPSSRIHAYKLLARIYREKGQAAEAETCERAAQIAEQGAAANP